MVRSGVRLLPGRRLEPPRRVPQLAPTQRGDTYLQEIVAGELGVDIATATEICRQWNFWTLAGGNGREKGNTMILEGVGRIRLSTLEFTPDTEFLNQLSPLSAEPLVAIPMAGSASGTGSKRMPVMHPVMHPGPRKRSRGGRGKAVKARGRNPHQYTLSFFTVLILLGALGYLGYYLWNNTSLLAGLQQFINSVGF
jgi:hypothetical protein